jgi:hypothetical protein
MIIAKNVIKDLEAAADKAPLLSTERGDFFAVPGLGLGALRLRGDLDAYLDFVSEANKGEAALAFLLPYQNPKFQVVVNTPVTVRDGKAFIAEKEFTLL